MIRRTLQRFRSDGATIPTPNPPPGSGIMFHANGPRAPYQVSFKKYTVVLLAGVLGAYSGTRFYHKAVMYPNPPNPQRLHDEVPPSKHPHAPEEEEDDDDE